MAEFPAVGEHCAFESCSQLDFLPFVCDQCQKIFCTKHKSCEVHGCLSNRFESAADTTVSSNQPLSYGCSAADCSRRELTLLICQECEKHFCLQHRFPDDHGCSSIQQPSTVSKPKLPQQLEDLRTAAVTQKPTAPSSALKIPAAGTKERAKYDRVLLMKLKMKATGEKDKVPESEKHYLSVLTPDGRELAIFVSKMWSVGRVVDSIAKVANLNNQNSNVAAPKLRLYVADCSDAVEMSAKVLETPSLYDGARVTLCYDHHI